MHASEAARVLFARIQALDPMHACRIMGHILDHNHDTHLIRLALGPDSLLRSLIRASKEELQLSHAAASNSRTSRTSRSRTRNNNNKKKLLMAPDPEPSAQGPACCSQQHMPTQSPDVITVDSSSEELRDAEDSFSDEDWSLQVSELKNEQFMEKIAQIQSDEMFARCLQEQINGEFHNSGGAEELLTQHDTQPNTTSSVRHDCEPNQMNRSMEPLYLNGQYFTLHESPLQNLNRRSIETRFSGAEMEYEMWLLSEVRKGLSSSQMDPARKAELMKELETMYENRSNEDLPDSSYADFYGDMFEYGDVDEPLGATDRQINNLPVSTVQGDKVEDNCAICLEAPSVGSVLRHLPCMHKLHKECIDRWLRIKDCCPICKMSISC